MILWHAGVAAVIVYVTLGRRHIDYRFIVLGAVLPDLVDAILSPIFEWPAGRGIAHSLTAAVAVTVAITVFLRGGLRQRAFGVGVGWLLHLVADGMWDAPKTFLWPVAGTGFAASPRAPYSWGLFTDPLAHLGTWIGELVGLAIVAWFVVAFRLHDPDRRNLFLRDGLLRP